MSRRELRIWIVLGLAVLAMLAIGLFGMPPARAQPMPLPPCVTAAETLASAEAMMARAGDVPTGSFEGTAALRVLDYLNHKVGEPTDYRADALVYAMAPKTGGMAVVGLMTAGCTTAHFTVPAVDFMLAVRAAFQRERPSI